MKKSLLLLLISFNVFSQKPIILNNNTIKTVLELVEINKGLKMLNDIRMFNELEPLKLNTRLNELASSQARKMANKTHDTIASIGESYYFQGVDLKIPINYYNGILGLTLKEDWIEKEAYQQLKCKTCTSVGFGKAKNNKDYYIFVVFDSIK